MDGNNDQSAGCPMSNSPYAEVAFTYLRKPFSSLPAVGLSILVFLLIIPLSFGIACEPRNTLIPALILFLCLSFLATGHAVGQFANPRARLMPHFFRVHITVAAWVVLAIGVFWPALVTLAVGYRSVGLIAIVIVSFGGAMWTRLAAPALNGLLGFLWIVLLIPPVGDVVEQLVSGKLELQAWGLLILGVAALVLAAVRLFRLSEDTPSYARLVRQGRAGWNDKGPNGPDSKRLVLWPWERQQETASAIWHARRAAVSPWSRIRRWQTRIIPARQVLVWIVTVIGAFTSNALAKGRVDSVALQQLLMILPGIAATIAMYHRPVAMATQLCLPVERRQYLRQLGAATVLTYLEVWFVISAPFVLWCLFARPRPDFAEVGRLLTVSLLSLVWYFGVGVWFARFRSPTSMIPLSAMGLLVLLVILAALYFTLIIPSRPFQLPAAVVAATIGVLLAGDAYRRWLITDLE
jgi:hypothetical protein